MEKEYFILKGYWKGYIITSKRLNKNYCQIQRWKTIVCCCIMHQTILLRAGAQVQNYRAQKQLCSNTSKRNKLKVYISLKQNELACFVNSEGSFKVHDLVHDFWKKCHNVSVFLCGASVAPKVQQGTHKNCAPEFLILSTLKLPPSGLVVLIGYEHWYRLLTESRNFKKIERKLYNCFSIASYRCYVFM